MASTAAGGEQQALRNCALDYSPEFGVADLLLLEKLGVGLLAEPAVEAAHLRHCGDLRIDKPPGSLEAIVVAEGQQRSFADQLLEHRIELVGNGRIGRFGILPLCLLQDQAHRAIHVAVGDFFASDLHKPFAAADSE